MGFMDSLKKLARPYSDEDEDDFDDYDDYEESAEPEPAPAQPKRSAFTAARSESRPAGRVVSLNSNPQLQVVLVKPDRFDSVSEIADNLRDRKAIVLNLEATNKDVARRLVDFLSGCAYALDGKIKKIAISTYLITPSNVDIVGDLMEELENSGMYY